jgi:WD repeat-containing protein 20
MINTTTNGNMTAASSSSGSTTTTQSQQQQQQGLKTYFKTPEGRYKLQFDKTHPSGLLQFNHGKTVSMVCFFQFNSISFIFRVFIFFIIVYFNCF